MLDLVEMYADDELTAVPERKTKMSGRKPVRTDYVYVVFSNDTHGPEDAAFRTFKSAKRHAKQELTKPTVTKIEPNVWLATSSLMPTECFSIIGRIALRD